MAAVVGFLVAETAVGRSCRRDPRRCSLTSSRGRCRRPREHRARATYRRCRLIRQRRVRPWRSSRSRRSGLSRLFVEGQDTESLQHGPGHVPGTSLPGQPGNAAVVGRRTTFGAPFRNLSALTAGEEINVTTVEGSATYKVTDVSWRSKGMFEPAKESTLTLVTSGRACWQRRTWSPAPNLSDCHCLHAAESPHLRKPSFWRHRNVGAGSCVVCGHRSRFSGGVLHPAAALGSTHSCLAPQCPGRPRSLLLAVRAIDTFLPATL